MTEIAVRQDAQQQSVALSVIQESALDLAAAHKIATAICSTALAPKDYRGKPEDGAAAIMLGATLGFGPMIALQNIFIVHGAPSMYARTMAAAVQAQGHKIWTEHEDTGTVTVCGQRKGSDKVERVTFTIDDAEKAGYVKQNTKYTTDPKSMLYARALSIACRRTAPDALLGVPYSVEEMEDVQAMEVRRVDEPIRSGVGRLAAAVAAPEAAPLERADTSPPAELISDAQNKRLHALLSEADKGNRDAGLAYISEVLDRPVASSKDLTKQEASRVIDALQNIQEAEEVPPPDEPAEADQVAAAFANAQATEPAAQKLSPKQGAQIFALLNAFGVRDRAAKMRVVSEMVQHPCASTDVLNADEATSIIDTLNNMSADSFRDIFTDQIAG